MNNTDRSAKGSSGGSLRRDLGLWTATSLVVGCVIGSGVFVKPGKVMAAAGSPSLALIAWMIGGFVSICGGLTIAEVAVRIPRTGGVYTYMEEIYGRVFGFLCGWVQTVIYGPALMGALGLYLGSLTTHFLGLRDVFQKVVAVIAVFGLASVNAIGSKYGGMVQRLTTAAKLVPIALIAVFGLIMGNEPIFGSASGLTGASVGMGAAILSTLWAYDGWMQVANVAGEMINPARDLPRAIVIGLGIVIVSYLGVNLALFHVVPTDQIIEHNERVAGIAASQLFGSWGGQIISLGILVSIFGAINGNIMALTRIPYAMALRKELPFWPWISQSSEQFGTPVNAIVAQTAIVIAMILLTDPEWLSAAAIFSVYLFYIMAFVGLFLLRRSEIRAAAANSVKPTNEYRVPLYPFVPILAIAGGLYIVASTIFNQPYLVLFSLIGAVSGLPYYYWCQRSGHK